MSGGRLLNAAIVNVADAKVRDYLLDAGHPGNGGKAGFFSRFGFTQAHWTVLQDALRLHPQANPVVSVRANRYGTVYRVSCSLRSPDGRCPCVNTVWVLEAGSIAPALVTAFP